MILKTVQVLNFKCIKDSTAFGIDAKVTCLVGKNESGKTAILQALEKLNPIESSVAKFDDLDYPRAELSVYRESDEAADAIETTWELTDEDADAVAEIVGPDGLTSRTIKIKKGYYEKSYWTISINESKAFKHFIDSADLLEEEREALQKTGSMAAAQKFLYAKNQPDASATAGDGRSAKEEAVFQTLCEFAPDYSFFQSVVAELKKRLPKMVYFGDYLRMPGQIALADLESRPAAKDEPDKKVFLALLGMIGRKVEELKGLNKFERLQADLEGASNRLTKEIFGYWSQNRNLKVQFRFEQALTGDPPPFNAGFIMRTRIENLRHGVSTSFDERSRGFVWFFSFLIWFSQVRKNYGENLVILLDEPGLALHAKAQGDLLRYIEERLAPKYQVIYTTHSPFMIDPQHLLRARTVEDVYIPPKNSSEQGTDLGTKVGDDVLSVDRDTLFPLQACLGYEITQTLFIGAHSLLVEGPAEVLYLPWFSRKLELLKRTVLDRRWTLTPCGGVDKIPAFLSLFGGQNLHIATLLDFATGQKGAVERMRKNSLLRAGHVFTLDQYCAQAEADIEDLIGRPMYIALVNDAYGLKDNTAIPTKKPKGAPIRVVKEVEGHFQTVAISGDEFNHYRPAEYLTQRGLDYSLPGLDDALNRFEKLFADLNALLPPK